MLDHFSIPIKNFAASENFYNQTLAILGYSQVLKFDMPEAIVAGYGKDEKPSFWIGEARGELPEEGMQVNTGFIRGLHLAFLAPSVEAVDQWYAKCLELGGKDNGEPGKREYHEGYYGAFIIDPDGWKIEACVHDAV